MTEPVKAIVVMGVASSGKSTLGEALAEALGAPFIEGDRLHAAESVAKMSKGIALTDEDRWPWLARIGEALAGDGPRVASCSALKRVYREVITRAAGRPVTFVHLSGTRAVLEERIKARTGHFMPASLLESQLATLEPPGPDENAVTLNIAAAPGQLLAQALAVLR